MQKITAGRIVNYKIAPHDLGRLSGNVPAAGDILPAIIVRVWNQDPGTCNLQVFADGPGTYWATSRVQGDAEGQWSWPDRGAADA